MGGKVSGRGEPPAKRVVSTRQQAGHTSGGLKSGSEMSEGGREGGKVEGSGDGCRGRTRRRVCDADVSRALTHPAWALRGAGVNTTDVREAL